MSEEITTEQRLNHAKNIIRKFTATNPHGPGNPALMAEASEFLIDCGGALRWKVIADRDPQPGDWFLDERGTQIEFMFYKDRDAVFEIDRTRQRYIVSHRAAEKFRYKARADYGELTIVDKPTK